MIIAAFRSTSELVVTMVIKSSRLANGTNIFLRSFNLVVMTSSLFMFTLDNIRYVFVVSLLRDKILSNPI